MNYSFITTICVLSIVALALGSCKKDSSANKESDVMEDPYRAEVESVSSNEKVTILANHKSKSILGGSMIDLTNKYVYQNGKVIKEIGTSKFGGMVMEVTQEYDEKSRLTMLQSVRDGQRSVLQYNTYTDDDLLLTEKRIERNSGAFDTTFLEFFYPEDRPNPMEYYSTRNGEKIKVMTLTKTGNKEVVEERSFSKENDFGFNTIYRTRDEQGRILEESSMYIHTNWDDKTKLDTSITEPVKMEYDEEGRVIRMEAYGALTVNGVVENEYDKDGILKKRIISKKDEPKKTIRFRKVRN